MVVTFPNFAVFFFNSLGFIPRILKKIQFAYLLYYLFGTLLINHQGDE